MYVTKGAGLYSFCPAKATWDNSVMQMFNALIIAAEMGSQYADGGIENQPEWWIELCAWFIPRYNDAKFYSRARAILGDGSKPKGK